MNIDYVTLVLWLCNFSGSACLGWLSAELVAEYREARRTARMRKKFPAFFSDEIKWPPGFTFESSDALTALRDAADPRVAEHPAPTTQRMQAVSDAIRCHPDPGPDVPKD